MNFLCGCKSDRALGAVMGDSDDSLCEMRISMIQYDSLQDKGGATYYRGFFIGRSFS